MLKKYFYIAVLIFAYTGANAVNYKQICNQNLSTACDFIFETTEMECTVSAFLLNRSSDLLARISRRSFRRRLG